MLERFTPYFRPPIFPDDEDKTFAASLLHVILWALLIGICLYTLLASLLALIPPHMLLTAWLYVLALGMLTATLLVSMRRGQVQRAAILINVGLWIVLTAAAYFNGGVAAPAYSGYLVVIVSTCLLVSWQWGLVAAVASALAGAVFLLAAANHWLPDWLSTYSLGSVWGANLAYFFIAAMLLSLALRAIKRAAQKTQREMAERLKTEQALRNSEQRFRAIFDSVNDAIFVQELGDGRILDVNQKMCEMYGYTVEEARRLTIEDLSAGTAPYRQQDVIDKWQKTAEGEPQVFEWHARDRAGRLFWVEVNMRRAVIDGQDRLLVVVRDIDERKRTEAALRREQAYYEAIVNATPVMLWLKDTENRLLHLNPAAAKFEGVDVADVEGKSCYELYPREQAEAYFQDDLEVIRSGQSKLGIVEQHTSIRTGNMMWVETGKVPVRDEQGDLVGVLACAIDITERKEAEQVQAATRQIAEAALMAQNLTEFYQAVHAIVSPLIPANNFYITLHDVVSDLFTTPYLFDEFDTEWPPYSPDKGLGAYVLHTGEPLLATPEVFAELEQQGKVEIIHRPMVEWLGVPLKTPHGVLGIMAVQNYSGPARLNDKHKDLLVFVSAQVAMAIERKRAEERERRVSQGLRAVIEATQELMNCVDLDTLYQRSVELAREKIGVERCGLYVLEDEEFLRGTFGTDDQGRTTDERPTRGPLEDYPEVLSLADQLWTSYDKPFTYWKDGHAQRLPGKGWNAATPIRSRNRMVGVLYNDAALTHAPLDETLQEVVAVYGSLLGSLIELKRAEADLAHERDWLQLLMDNFPDTIYFKDAASRFTRINRAQTILLGLTTAEEAIGKTDADFFQNGELAQQFLTEEQHLMTSGEPIIDRVEYNPTPAGQPRWLSASKVPLRDVSGQVVGLVGISRDISDRMLAEQREKTISQGLRAVIDATQELIDCADLDMLYRRGVELAREKLGLERCGLHLLDEDQQHLLGTYGTDEHGQTIDERHARVAIAERSEIFTLPGRLWNVLYKPFNYLREGEVQVLPQSGWIAATPLRSRRQNIGMFYNDTALSHKPLDQTQQEVVAVYGSVLGSLIELKHTEAKLAHERDLLQSLMDNTPDAIYFKDTASRFTHVNQAMIRILELHEPSEAVGKADANFFSGTLNQLYLDEEQELLRTGQPLLDRVEYNPTNDGRPRWFSASKVPLRDAGGQIAGMVGISRDVTERVLAQRRDQTISRGLRAVIEAADELIGCADLDTLYRRAVELAREKLAVERCGLFTLDEQGWLRGTYGTDLQRHTSDEREAHFAPINLPGLDAASDQLWNLIESEHAFWEGDAHQVFGAGWVGVTFIRTRDRVMGVLYNDTAITHAPVDEAQQEVLAVYCSLLGSLIELQHAERERTESELLFRRAISAAGAVPYYLDYATESYRFMGQGILAMTGVLSGDMQPSRWDTLIVEAHPLGQARGLSQLEAVQASRAGRLSEWRCDYRVRQPDGAERWLTDASIPVLDEQGQPRGAIGILQDITERKQAEAAMQESEALFRQLAENAPALIALTDEYGQATYLNRAWREFRGEVPSLPLDEWSAQIHPADRERYLHEFRSTLQARRKITIEYRLRRSDGQYRWLLDTMVPRYAADENFAGLIGIAIDMTDRKNVEEALRRSESQLRLLTENMVDTISQIDAQYRVLYVSPSIQRELGYQPIDLLGQRLLDVLHPDDARTFYHQMIMAISLRVPTLRLVYRQRHAAGHYLWIESEIQLLYDGAGEFAGAVFGSRDVSARQQAGAERENLISELEEKNAELERFTYTVSHDLKSPLITIRGFLGFLEKDAAAGNLERLRADIGRIADAATRMQRLLDELLSLSRVGRLANAPQEIAFEALVQEAVELVQGRIMARGVQVEIAENLPTVYGDYARLVEVLQNLIDNAVKFMGDQAEPRITIGALGSDREGLPIFFVQDNGLGIDPNYHERVFGLFNKLDARSEGTGVGLALVKRIIEVHGGHIWVESDGAGQGTTFLFTLPRHSAASAP